MRPLRLTFFVSLTLLVIGGVSATPTMDLGLNEGGYTRLTLEYGHDLLGVATLASGLATGVFDPNRAGHSVHETLAWTTAGLATATMLSGMAAYWDKMGLDMGWGPDHTHALLGAIGGSMIMVAPFVAPDRSHALLGEGGVLLMGLAVVLRFVSN